jgi:hypothetical protein
MLGCHQRLTALLLLLLLWGNQDLLAADASCAGQLPAPLLLLLRLAPVSLLLHDLQLCQQQQQSH